MNSIRPSHFLTHSLTSSLPHSLTLLSHFFPHSLTHSLTHSRTLTTTHCSGRAREEPPEEERLRAADLQGRRGPLPARPQPTTGRGERQGPAMPLLRQRGGEGAREEGPREGHSNHQALVASTGARAFRQVSMKAARFVDEAAQLLQLPLLLRRSYFGARLLVEGLGPQKRRSVILGTGVYVR